MIRILASLILTLFVVLLGACGNGDNSTKAAQSRAEPSPNSVDTAVFNGPNGLENLKAKRVFEPQATILGNGTLLLTWRERGETGSNIYISVRGAGGIFGPPVRVNDESDTVESIAHDGMRAAIALAATDKIAIAWSDSRAQIRAAVSHNGGTSFASSIRLDQSDEAAYRGFPSISFDASENLHAIWIDSRFAEDFAEEPADLFYATIANGEVTETNLTVNQEPSICGCCRTFINADKEKLSMTFRNTTADGYRDPFVISGNLDGGFSEPLAVTDPLWEINGCPMAGPILADGEVLWHDGSTGKKLIMISSPGETQARRMFSDDVRGDWIGRQPPRAVSMMDASSSLLLLPGQPTSRLIVRRGKRWDILADDLPSWATSGAYYNGSLYVVGAPAGELKFEQRALSAQAWSQAML
jgi:hypothetical protein